MTEPVKESAMEQAYVEAEKVAARLEAIIPDPELVANILERLNFEFPAGGLCTTCGEGFPYLSSAPDYAPGGNPQYCRACERIREEAKGILVQLEGHVAKMLVEAGLAPVELRARLDEIPTAIATRLPQATVRAMLHGETPAAAFGIIGAAGAGKTMALAAILAQMTRQRVRTRAPMVGVRALDPWLIWLPWPETVNEFRIRSMGENGVRLVAEDVERAIAAELLVLDDVGAERIRGAFQDDATASKLDLIVDGRHRELRPTFFTSNVDSETLRGKYGDRLHRRLLAGCELVKVT